jgi:hypothetical protein
MVILIGSKAIKTPTIKYSWRLFLTGLLANLHERLWWGNGKDERLCPIVFADPLGLFVVMQRTEDIDYLPPEDDFRYLPLDYKVENFGLLNGKVVLRDYG